MNGLQAVEDLAVYLHKNLNTSVFKFEKTAKYQGSEYIVVNHLPFTFGKVVNSDNMLNVNIHATSNSSGNADILRLSEILTDVSSLIPFESGIEDNAGINIKGVYYSIISVSQPIEDTDKTYFLNLKVKVIINELNV